MKLKGSLAKFGVGKLALTTGVLFIVMLALRFYQLTALTDPATGFFTDHTNPTVILFYILAIGSVIAFCALAYLSEGAGNASSPGGRHIPLGVASMLFAVPLVMEGIDGVRQILEYKNAYYSFKDAISALGGYIYLVAPVFALLSAAAMLLNGYSFLTGNGLIGRLKILLLTPALWAFFLTISYFKITMSYLKVSQLMLTIFADAFLMIFLFEYARLISGIGIKESAHAFYGTGFAAAFLLLATELPNLFFTLLDKEKLVVHCEFRLYNLLAALFVVAALLYAARSGGQTAEQPAAEIPEAAAAAGTETNAAE